MAASPERKPTALSRAVKALITWLYHVRGWQLEGGPPGTRKFVITGAPHTSNWDFVFFLGATRQLGIQPAFMGKKQLFRWPMTRFMQDMGGIAVDRSKRSNYVDQIAAEFARRDELALVIAPEGTRSSDGHWRSGFYHIALAAGVPIVPAWVDNATMCGGLGPPIMPGESYGRTLLQIAQFMLSKMPDCERIMVLEAQARRLIEEEDDG